MDGWSGLWIFINPLREGAEDFMLVYLHLMSLGIRVGLCFTVFLICNWNVSVGSRVAVWKFWSLRK